MPEYAPPGKRGALYSLCFNFRDLKFSSLLATCGRHGASVFCLQRPDKPDLRLVSSFRDEDKDEDLYACAWASCHVDARPLLVVGGFTGVIKVLDVANGSLRSALLGHGNCVNSIAVRAAQRKGEGDLVITASKDESIRVWNLRNNTCVLVLAGAGGHTGEITAVDYSHANGLLLSCGLDNAVKVWSLRVHEGEKGIIRKSHEWEGHPSSFPTRFVQYPMHSSSKVHGNYVDSVAWLGDLILSKSVDDQVLLWAIKEMHKDGDDDRDRGDDETQGDEGRAATGNAATTSTANAASESTKGLAKIARTFSPGTRSRWSADRYARALKCVKDVIKNAGAMARANALPRPVLRDEARNRVGDTGMLDHILKHMIGVSFEDEIIYRNTISFEGVNGLYGYWIEGKNFDTTTTVGPSPSHPSKSALPAAAAAAAAAAAVNTERKDANGMAPATNDRFTYEYEAEFTVLGSMRLTDASIWFIKFSTDFAQTKLACGNHTGVVHVWSIAGANTPKLLSKLTMKKAMKPLRQTAISMDGSVVAACTDDGYVWTWKHDIAKGEAKKSIAEAEEKIAPRRKHQRSEENEDEAIAAAAATTTTPIRTRRTPPRKASKMSTTPERRMNPDADR